MEQGNAQGGLFSRFRLGFFSFGYHRPALPVAAGCSTPARERTRVRMSMAEGLETSLFP